MNFKSNTRTWLLDHPNVNPYRINKEKSLKPFRQLTGSIRVLPDFIILGAPRCGTTSLYYNMIKHPEIFPAAGKSAQFFDEYFEEDLNNYRSFFPTKIQKFIQTKIKKSKFVTGEATPSYLFHPDVPKRIANSFSSIKLIILLRNPIDRAYSHFNYHKKRKEAVFPTFEKAIEYEKSQIDKFGGIDITNTKKSNIDPRFCSYLSRGIYVDQLKIWFNNFKKEQILIIKSENFEKNNNDTLLEVFNFLNLTKVKLPNVESMNTEKYSKIEKNTRNELLGFFKPHNERFYKFMNQDFGWNK